MNKIVYRIKKWIGLRGLNKAYDRAEELEIKALMKYYYEELRTDIGEMFSIINYSLDYDEKKEYYDLQVRFDTIDSHDL